MYKNSMNGKALPKGVGQVISDLHLELSLDELLVKAGRVANKAAFRNVAAGVLKDAGMAIRPMLVYRWLDVAKTGDTEIELTCSISGECTTINLGFSIQFAAQAQKALVGVYTVGNKLESLAKDASANGLHLDAYIYDLIALEILEKVKCKIDGVAEQYAADHGWGVTPFLSPGSVHGWELEDQHNLIALLPINLIGVEKTETGLLLPFKSLSFFIGTGSGLSATRVGTSCQVCARKENCELRTFEK